VVSGANGVRPQSARVPQRRGASRPSRLRDRLNFALKRRVWYQPFCPAMLESEAPRVLVDWTGGRNRSMTMAYEVSRCVSLDVAGQQFGFTARIVVHQRHGRVRSLIRGFQLHRQERTVYPSEPERQAAIDRHRRHPLASDKHSIATLQIVDPPPSVTEGDQNVLAAYMDIIDTYFAVVSSSDVKWLRDE
jgi:hypothetical protein